jgi:hypothetical protein
MGKIGKWEIEREIGKSGEFGIVKETEGGGKKERERHGMIGMDSKNGWLINIYDL